MGVLRKLSAMKIAVHIDSNLHKDSYAPRWIDLLKKRNVDVLEADFKSPGIIQKVRGCDGVMWHWFHTPDDKQSAPKILQAIELGLGIPVFPSLKMAWHYDEKIAQFYLLDAINAPKIPTWVFWKYEDALDFIRQCEYPVIFKLSVGAGSANVLKLNSFKEAKAVVDKIFNRGFFPYTVNEFARRAIPGTFKEVLGLGKRIVDYNLCALKREYPPLPHYFLAQKNYAYFQKFIPGNNNDIRITVIGNRAFGIIRYNRPGDFRASGSGNFDPDPKNIPLQAVSIAHKISQDNNFQSMAYDFLLSNRDNFVISEISYCYTYWVVDACPGYWDRDLNWHAGQMRPEEAHVEDFISYLQHNRRT